MNIAYIVPALRNKGPIIVVKELVNLMLEKGHKCSVFYFDSIGNISISCPTYQISFFKSIHFNDFDIIHSHGIRPDAYVFFHKPLNSKTRFISTLHNYIFRDLSFQYNKLIAYSFGFLWILLLKRHNLVVTLSKDAMTYYLKWFKPSLLTYAYNTRSISIDSYLSFEEEKQIKDFKQDSLLIGVNALLTNRKGIDMLIKALARLPKYKLFIVGEGKSESNLRKLVNLYNVNDRVLFAGYHKDAYRYLLYYDIFAIPSRSEGFPLSLLEASAVGIPIVCSDILVFKELFTSEEVAFFELENIDSLVRAILYAENNVLLAKNIYQRYINNYSPKKFYERYINIYKSLL